MKDAKDDCDAGPFRRPKEDGSTLHENDPELERDFRTLAQWLLDIHRAKRSQQWDTPPQDGIDSVPPSPTM